MLRELGGISLVALENLKVDAMVRTLPRISTPPLTEVEVGQLDPADFVALGGILVGFLAKTTPALTDLPRQVEEVMADIAAVFHWALRDMKMLSLEELLAWRERARERSER